MKIFHFLAFAILVFTKTIIAGEITKENSWEGLKSSMTYLYQGSYMQFTAQSNFYLTAAAVPSLWYSFEEDKRLSEHARTKKIPKYMQIPSDLAPVLSFPLIPIAFFTYGVKSDNNHAVEFAKESFATMYLALLESAALSAIPIHDRPVTNQLSKWETNFRQKSSFPSGHVVPYAAFAIKAFQFYGPYYAIIPSALLLATSIQRVRDGKHYVSDIVGGVFLTAFAAEGVRKAADYKKNNIVFRSFIKRDVSIGYISYQGVIGPKLSINW